MGTTLSRVSGAIASHRLFQNPICTALKISIQRILGQCSAVGLLDKRCQNEATVLLSAPILEGERERGRQFNNDNIFQKPQSVANLLLYGIGHSTKNFSREAIV